MTSKKLLLTAFSVLVLAPALLIAGPQVGDRAPNFVAPDTAGINHILSQYRGQVVHLLFWAST